MKVFTNRFILTYHVEEPCPCKVAAPLFEPGFKSLARGIMGRGEVVWQRPKRICESWKLRAMRPLTNLELSPQLHGALPEIKVTRAEEYIQERRGTFRAHFKKSGHTYSGPRRTLKAEAVEDAKKLLAAADVSIPALQAAERSFRQQHGSEAALAKAVREAMLHWLQQGSTADLRGCSRALKTRMRRAAAGSEQARNQLHDNLQTYLNVVSCSSAHYYQRCSVF